MNKDSKFTIRLWVAIAFVIAGMTAVACDQVMKPEAGLGGCISLSLIKHEAHTAPYKGYCWEEASGNRYCLQWMNPGPSIREAD